MKKGAFSQPEVKQMLKYSLTPQQRKDKMVAKLSLADTWEAVGEVRGEARGVKKQARLTVLRGYFNNVQTDILLLLCGLPQSEVFALGKDYETIKKAWKNKETNSTALTKNTSLTDEEIKFVLACLDSISMA